MFENLDIPLDELLQMSDDETQVIYDAVYHKVVEYCEKHKIDFEKVDYEYGVSVSINISGIQNILSD